MNGQVIRLNAQQRLLTKARAYVNDASLALHASDQAIVTLVKAFKNADEELKLKIVLLLGAQCRRQVIWPLYKLMHDVNESELIRQAAAVQLSILGGILSADTSLAPQLIEDLHHPDPFVRTMAALALGWEGNRAAAAELIALLSDEDPEVQQAAVNALANLHDEDLFNLLADRLTGSPHEQKRAILYNLFRFTTRRAEALAIYEGFIRQGDPALRYDALLVFQIIAAPADHLDLYRHCLADGDYRLRELALRQLLNAPADRIGALRATVLAMTCDSQADVRQAAVRLHHHIQPAAVTQPSVY